MTQHLRHLILTALLTFAPFGTAHAGDAAARKIIGFSPNGGSFAFEQYSQLYDSTEVIAEIQVLDIESDGAVKTTSVSRLTKSDDEIEVDTVRAELAINAKPELDKRGINEPGRHFAGKPSMNLDEIGIYQMDPQPLAKTQTVNLPDGRKLVIDISSQARGKASCEGAGGRGTKGSVKVAGVTLRVSIDGATPVIRHQDEKLPYARRCVNAYGIAETYHHQAPDGSQTLAVLIETVDSNNYHAGPNRRFMAVLTTLPKP